MQEIYEGRPKGLRIGISGEVQKQKSDDIVKRRVQKQLGRHIDGEMAMKSVYSGSRAYKG